MKTLVAKRTLSLPRLHPSRCVGFVLWALYVMVGCAETTSAGGAGGASGTGGNGGDGGTAGDGGSGGSIGQAFPCTEEGLRDAIAQGGGPLTFDCDGPTTVVTLDQIEIDNDVILDGSGELTVDGDGTHGVFLVQGGVAAELRGFVVSNGATTSAGAGFANAGTLTLVNSAVVGNTVIDDGCGFNLEPSVCNGGGISNSGTLVLFNSTISNNSAPTAGGGIAHLAGTMALTNSTVSENTAFAGGGIASLASMELTHVTMSGNTAAMPSSNCIFSSSDSALVRNSVLGCNCSRDITSPGAADGFNIESPGDTCGFDQPTDQVSVSVENLNLGPLQDNGGPTMTHALVPVSVAIDVIPEETCELVTDQRGITRPLGPGCDVGAFELGPT